MKRWTIIAVLLCCLAPAATAAVSYKGLTIHGSPTAAAGIALDANFTTLVDRTGSYIEHTAAPTATDDINGPQGAAYENTLWKETTSDPDRLYLCLANTDGAAVWVRLVTESPITGAITFIGASEADVAHTFDGTSNDGVMTWMEDEAEFRFDSSIKLPSNTVTIQLGQGSHASISNPAFIVDRSVNASGENYHAFGDESVYDLGAGDAANSFDCYATISGDDAYNHFVAFQARPVYSSKGNVGSFGAYTTALTLNDTGSVTTHCYGYKHNALSDTGAGTVAAQYGFFNEDTLTGTVKYAFYDAGSNDNYFTGRLGVGITPVAGGSNLCVQVASGGASNGVSVFSTGGAEIVSLYTDNAGDGIIETRLAAGAVKIQLQSSGDSYLTGGNVGIGETSPNSQLDVNGTTRLGDSDTNYTAVSATGNQSFAGSAGFYPRVVSQDGKPAAGTGATQCDSGEYMMWIDTNDSNKVYGVYNNGGTVVAVLMAL